MTKYTELIGEKFGPYDERPLTGLYTGRPYYDTTLDKPLWWDGVKWVGWRGYSNLWPESPEKAIFMADGTTYSGVIGPTANVAWFKVHSDYPEQMDWNEQVGWRFDLQNIDGKNIIIQAYDDELGMISEMGNMGTGDISTPNILDYYVTEPTYLAVWTEDGEAGGYIVTAVRLDGRPNTAEEVESSGRVDDYYDASMNWDYDVDWFWYNVDPGQSVIVQHTSGVPVKLDLYDGDQNFIKTITTTSGGGSATGVEADANGDFYIKASYVGYTGDYRINVAANDSGASTLEEARLETPYVVGNVINATIDSPGDVDWYRFQLEANNPLSIYWEVYSGVSIGYELWATDVNDENLEQKAFNYSTGGGGGEEVPMVTWTGYLYVKVIYDNAEGAYSFGVTQQLA